MAAIAGELSKQIKGHSEGAQGFRPWWDVVEDNVLYSFVVLGLITLPMSFFSKTPIECTPHPKMWGNATEIKGLARMYPKTYCTEMLIEPFLLYLPFTLLLVPILLTGIEKTFVILYQVEEKMNQFYLLLVKESLNNEDVASLIRDNVKDCHEIEQAFKTSNDCYTSYFYRTLLEIIGSALLALMFSFYYGSPGIGVPFFDCMVYGALFECLVPNSKFFLYIYIISFILIGAYLLCSIYNFIWIISPKVGTLSRFLDGCSRQRDSYTAKIKKIKGPEIRLNLYFKPGAHDFSMLINLLAESQGLPEALRILALFEHQFAALWEPTNIQLVQKRGNSVVTEASNDNKTPQQQQGNNVSVVLAGAPGGVLEGSGLPPSPADSTSSSPPPPMPPPIMQSFPEKEKRLHSLVVSWDDAQISDYFHQCYRSKFTFEYTVEISPATEAPIKSILYYNDSSWMQCERLELLGNNLLSSSFSDSNGGNEKSTPFFEQMLQARKYSLTFDGLEYGQTYKLTFSTEINGRTIMQSIRNFDCSED